MTGHPTITLPGGFSAGRIADRVPARGGRSGRSHACPRRRCIPAGHVLASPPSFPDVMEATLSIQSASPNSRIFHGWFVVAAAFAVTFVGFGCAYTFSAFLEPLQRDFGASRGSVSLVFSLAGFLYFGLGIVSGPLADRFGSRRLAVVGMLLIGLGLAAASCRAQPGRGLRRLRAGRRTRRRLRLCSRGRRGAALVRPAPRLCLRPCRQRHRRRHAGDAAARHAPDRNPGMAQRLSRARRPRRHHRRRAWRCLLENDPRDRGLGPDGDPPQPGIASGPAARALPSREAIRSRRFISALCRLPDLLVRRVRAVRASRPLCRGSRRCAVDRPYCCSGVIGDRLHRRTLLSRRPRRPDRPTSLPCC